jgi:hypothetical protein
MLLATAGVMTAQNPDAISGATLKVEYLDQYNADYGVRAYYNNDNFDNAPWTPLTGILPVLEGEILNPGQARFWECDPRTVYVKESVRNAKGEPEFVGSFRYRGYSLADLVKDVVVEKANKEEYNLRVDMYVVVENDRGESAVFSWGELFYSKRGQDIIFATEVAPIFPSADDTRWESPTEYRIVAANDMFAVRYIDNPVRIIIKSCPVSFPGEKGLKPIYSPELTIHMNSESVAIDRIPRQSGEMGFETAFFGGHMGFKYITEFRGYPLKDVLLDNFSFTDEEIRTGVLAVAAKDSYRVVWSLAEILNRADAEHVLLQDYGKDEDGRFIILPSADFFADRRLKAASIAYIIDGTRGLKK